MQYSAQDTENTSIQQKINEPHGSDIKKGYENEWNAIIASIFS